MRTRVSSWFLGGLAATALASGYFEGSVGQGKAADAGGSKSTFAYQIMKTGQDGHFHGNFRLDSENGKTGLRLSKIDSIAIEGDRASFTGKGVEVKAVDGSEFQIAGDITVRIEDGMNEITPKGKDKISVHFEDPSRLNTFNFEGEVCEGDASVFRQAR